MINIKSLALAVSILALSACATYQPRPLSEKIDLATDITALKVEADAFPLPQLKKHPFDLSDGLDWVEVAMLAVANNPSLKASRHQRGEASAQVYAAGLLPDPQLSVGVNHATNGGPDRVEGIDLGIGVDLQALMTRDARSAASKAARREVDLQLLWQEWQVVQRARLLMVQVESVSRRLALLEKAQAVYEDRYRRTQRLLKRGDLTLDAAGAVATAWFNTSSRLNRERQVYSRVLHELHALLGLAPEVKLSLVPIKAPDTTALTVSDKDWSDLPHRRPDLRALQAGYQSQEQRVRKAILGQFPSLNVGFARARDTDGLYTTGFGISLNLPFFSGNRGQIALERATRERLRAEYQTRLNQSRNDVSRLLDRQRILAQQHAHLLQRLPELASLVTAAHHAYRDGDLPALDLLNLDTTLLDKRLEVIELEQALWQVRIALDTLLARPELED